MRLEPRRFQRQRAVNVMRYVGILVCVCALIATAWHAAMRGTDQAAMLGAPQIQAIVDGDIREAVVPLASHPIVIKTDGRNSRLSGPVNSEDEHQQILAAARKARLLVTLTDDLVVLPTAQPYLFGVLKDPDGGIVLSGNVPTDQVREALLAQARSQSGGGTVSDRLVMAAGVPKGDWTGMATTALRAISELREGGVQISGTDAIVSGTSTDQEAAGRLIAAINADPMGNWQVQIAGALPTVEQYAFSALKAQDGSLIVDGNAPDEAVRDQLLQAAQAISSAPVSGALQLADGMPSPAWPEAMRAGLDALGAVESGMLSATGPEVTLQAEVETDDDLALLLPLLRDDWTTDITVRNPTPDARIEITLDADGGLKASGLLPDGAVPELLSDALPGINLDAVDVQTRGRPADWIAPLDGLEIILPRFDQARAVLMGKTVVVTGRLKRGFSADGAEAAMKSALDRSWTLDLDLVESAPLAELILSERDGDIGVSGVLPLGLDPLSALALLGDAASGEGLSGGGDGDPQAWAAALTATKGALARFRDSTGRIAEGQIELNGRLLPGYPAPDMQQWVSQRLPEGWSISLSADEIPPSEGDQRTSLDTGEAQNFRQGFWLPDVDFAVSPEQCALEVDAALERERILFVTGSARIDQKGRNLLNRLAAVAVRCLNSSGISLQIGGHTDSVGNDENNLQLSQERANAVMAALLERGARAEAVSATGFGENEPVATNDTAEGRALNRRISFSWSERAN